jgi:hypothetical protein
MVNPAKSEPRREEPSVSDLPATALLVSPFPSPALRLLADGLTDIEVADDTSMLAEHHQVILSGAVSGEAVAAVAAELSRRPKLRVGVDLAHPPLKAALGPLASFYHGGQERIGHLPVAMVAASGEIGFAPQDVDELAKFLHAGQPEVGDPASMREDLYALATELADREHRIVQLEARLREVESRARRVGQKLTEERTRVARLRRRHAAARRRAEAAEQHVLLRMVRVYRRAYERVPGAPWAPLIAGAVGLLVAAVLVAELTSLSVAAVSIAAVVILLALVGAVALALLVAASRHRRAQPAHSAGRTTRPATEPPRAATTEAVAPGEPQPRRST